MKIVSQTNCSRNVTVKLEIYDQERHGFTVRHVIKRLLHIRDFYTDKSASRDRKTL